MIPSWADKNLLVPLDGMMTPAEWKEFQETAYPVAKKIGIYKGRLYGVTTGTNVWGLYYSPAHLKAAGLDPKHFPTTLDGVLEWGHRLNQFDKRGNLIRMGFMPSWFAEFAPVFGGGFCDWKTGKVTLDTPENLRALTFLVNERKKLGFANVVRFESGLRNTSSGAGDWPFIGGFYSITLDGMWRVEELRKYNEQCRKDGKPEIIYGTAPAATAPGRRERRRLRRRQFSDHPQGSDAGRGRVGVHQVLERAGQPEAGG